MKDNYFKIQNQTNTPAATANEVHEALEESLAYYSNMSDKTKEIYDTIDKNYPTGDNKLNILGSQAVLQGVRQITAQKWDMDIPMKDLKVVEIVRSDSKHNELKINVYPPDHREITATAVTIYEGKKQFLDKAFVMNDFADATVKKELGSLVLSAIAEIQAHEPNQEFKYRFVNSNGISSPIWNLRAVVTKNGYKLFDNNIVLFLALMATDQYSKDTNQKFFVKEFWITDSKMDLFLLATEPKLLEGGVKMSTGIRVSNSELGTASSKFLFSYRLSYKGKTVTLLDESPVFTVNHNHRPETIVEDAKSLAHLNQYAHHIEQAINAARLYHPGDEIALGKLFAAVLPASKKIDTFREGVLSLQEKMTASQTSLTLLELFSKLDQLASDTNDSDLIWEIRARLNDFIKSEL